MPSQFASYLRVYEPLAAFDRPRQERWRRYIDGGHVVAQSEGPVRQRAAVWSAMGAVWARLPELPDEAYVLEVAGATLVCPWNLRVRVAQAALVARDGVPPVLADAFVPPALVSQAQLLVDEWRDSDAAGAAGGRLHEQVATWGVPLRWFVFVEQSERELSLRAPRFLRYRTEISKARRRAHRGVSVLRKSVGDAPITDALEESARWLEEFHPRSVVELDYGGLVDLLTDEELTDDDSPRLAAAGLTGLGRGEAGSATSAYEKLVDRWRAVQLQERCN
ncbi:hypothetical protein [Pilimelia columellifera]|uniref:DUF8083 domain-containing protein n=1 Tax=Pilimelia columellifera subsp. columellifera TaxID=706583 RepID=A0ABP6AGJ3_9ACTN